MDYKKSKGKLDLTLPDKCCKADTGCEFDGTLRKVKTEPIYVQKVYDSALFNLQGLRTVEDVIFRPRLPKGAKIVKVVDIRCKRFFNPDNINDPKNLIAIPETEISGGQFVKGFPPHKENEESRCELPDIKVIGPDGMRSEKLIYADTTECDDEKLGTPVFGTQKIRIRGAVKLELDVIYMDHCDKECEITLYGIAHIEPLFLTNFFELCVPSVYNSAFLPRFTEFCNISCETRLATNSIYRDIKYREKGIAVDLLIAICITCEKKIVVPVQLCVLSTGFPKLKPSIEPICSNFPTLFPKQIDEKKRHFCCGEENIED